MLKTIEDITDRIVERLAPESIILFGSRSTDAYSEESDVDLLIVANTTDRPIDRRIAVEGALADRAMPLDILVYTPQEVRSLFAMGSPFIEEVFETGRILYMRKPTQAWVRDAEEELSTARILDEHAKYRGTCLHAQQCVEKCLKALVIEKGAKPERTHDLLALRSHAHSLDWDLALDTDDAVFLNSVYKGRYPSEEGLLPHGEPTAEDGRRSVDTAAEVFQRVRSLLAPSSEQTAQDD